jgi:hypothetical protein
MRTYEEEYQRQHDYWKRSWVGMYGSLEVVGTHVGDMGMMFDDWVAYQTDVSLEFQREQEAFEADHLARLAKAEALYARLEGGETLSVRLARGVPDAHIFTITQRRDKATGTVRGYTVRLHGKVAQGYNGLLLDRERVLDWFMQLEEEPVSIPLVRDSKKRRESNA